MRQINKQMRVKEETRQRLHELKQDRTETFDSVINRLIALEKQIRYLEAKG